LPRHCERGREPKGSRSLPCTFATTKSARAEKRSCARLRKRQVRMNWTLLCVSGTKLCGMFLSTALFLLFFVYAGTGITLWLETSDAEECPPKTTIAASASPSPALRNEVTTPLPPPSASSMEETPVVVGGGRVVHEGLSPTSCQAAGVSAEFDHQTPPLMTTTTTGAPNQSQVGAVAAPGTRAGVGHNDALSSTSCCQTSVVSADFGQTPLMTGVPLANQSPMGGAAVVVTAAVISVGSGHNDGLSPPSNQTGVSADFGPPPGLEFSPYKQVQVLHVHSNGGGTGTPLVAVVGGGTGGGEGGVPQQQQQQQQHHHQQQQQQQQQQQPDHNNASYGCDAWHPSSSSSSSSTSNNTQTTMPMGALHGSSMPPPMASLVPPPPPPPPAQTSSIIPPQLNNANGANVAGFAGMQATLIHNNPMVYVCVCG
jgi:hypothetical protein